MTLASFFVGLLVLVYGVVTHQYNYRYTNMFGRSAFVEQWFGSMYTFTKLTSILAALIGLMIMFGLGDNLANFITSPFQNTFGS